MPAPARPNPGFSNNRRWLNWLNALLAVFAVLALVIMANYLAGGHFKRFQMDRDSAFRLSPQTRHVLDSLTNDVNITIFFEPHGANEEIYGLSSALLTEYQEACPRHIHIRTIDYDRDIGAAKEFLAKAGENGPKDKDFIHFECGGATKIVLAKELAQYDFNDLMAGRSKTVRRSAFLGELHFTGGINDVSNPGALKAYFLYGHGENDPEENKANTGYSKLAGILRSDENCEWQKLSLTGTNAIPADCSLLIIPASAREGTLLPEELDKIATYLKQGGRLLALLTVHSGLETVLGQWGVSVGNSHVVDMDKRLYHGEGTFLTAKVQPHPIMDPLAIENIQMLMVFPRFVYGTEEQSKVPGAPQLTILAETSTNGMNEARKPGTYPLLLAVEQGGIQGVNSPGGRGTRIVVAGDSDFLDDQVIDLAGNHLFAHQTLGWLLQRPQTMLTGLGPRAIREYKLYMTAAQSQALAWLFLAGMPGAILLMGGVVWLRRRS